MTAHFNETARNHGSARHRYGVTTGPETAHPGIKMGSKTHRDGISTDPATAQDDPEPGQPGQNW
jgi:hypothetical protein